MIKVFLFIYFALVFGSVALAEDDLSETKLAYTAKEAFPLENVTNVHLMEGDGQVRISPADTYSVTVVSGEIKTEIYTNKAGNLRISCSRRCRERDDRFVHVKGPAFRVVTVFGVGMVGVDKGFETQDEFFAYVLNDGVIKALNLKARNVTATVVLGGQVEVTALETLKASVNGPNAFVFYEGDTRVEATEKRGGKVGRVSHPQ